METKSKTPHNQRPPSSYAKGAGLFRHRWPGNIKWNLLRDNFELSTLLAFGAALQLTLSFTPSLLSYSPFLQLVPAGVLLLGKGVYTIAVLLGMLENRRKRGILIGAYGPSLPVGFTIPSGEKIERQGLPRNGEIGISIIASQCSHPFGYLAPRNNFDDVTDEMIRYLELNAAETDFLGATSWLNTSQHTSGNMMMTMVYFRSNEDVKRFHENKMHNKETKFSADNRAKGVDYIGLYQENYQIRKGDWDAFSVKINPAMLDATTFLVEDENGEMKWEGIKNMFLGNGMDFIKRRERWKDPQNPVEHWKLEKNS